MKKLARAGHMAMVAALALCCAHPAIAAENRPQAEERIPFALPSLKADEMPPVFFAHERHVEWMEAAGKDCAVCHVETASGMSEYFMKSEFMPQAEVVPYVHQACVACHASIKPGAPTGPLLVSCRACHSSGASGAQTSK